MYMYRSRYDTVGFLSFPLIHILHTSPLSITSPLELEQKTTSTITISSLETSLKSSVTTQHGFC